MHMQKSCSVLLIGPSHLIRLTGAYIRQSQARSTGPEEDLLVANPNHALRLTLTEHQDDNTPPESASEGDEKREVVSSDDNDNEHL